MISLHASDIFWINDKKKKIDKTFSTLDTLFANFRVSAIFRQRTGWAGILILGREIHFINTNSESNSLQFVFIIYSHSIDSFSNVKLFFWFFEPDTLKLESPNSYQLSFSKYNQCILVCEWTFYEYSFLSYRVSESRETQSHWQKKSLLKIICFHFSDISNTIGKTILIEIILYFSESWV